MTFGRIGIGAGMVALVVVLSAGLVLVPAGEAHHDRLPADAVAKALAGTTLVALDGSKLEGRSLHGQVVVVTFWATWCKPCRREMPRLGELDRSLAKKGGRVIAISIDEEPANVRRFAKALGLTMPLFCDGPRGLAQRLDLAQVPSTFVLDKDGTTVHVSKGSSDADLDQLAAVAERLSGVRGGTASAERGAE